MSFKAKKNIFVLTLLCPFLAVSFAFSATSPEYYQAGLRFYNQKKYGEAVRYFKAAIQEDPSNWQAYQLLGYSYYAQGDASDAKAAMDESLSKHPDNPGLRSFKDRLGGSQTTFSPAGKQGGSPVIGGGNFGLGLDFGGPGTWGATGKFWLDSTSAFQGALKLDGTVLQLQYLWHDYDLIHPSRGALPFYIGIGGDLAVGGGIAVAACAPIGLTYLFQKKTIPVDIFVEGVPTLWFYSGGIFFELYGNIGARYYF